MPGEVALVVDKLNALLNLYNEMALLLDVSLEDSPLRLGKVETGSLWVWVFGDTRIIEFMTGTIERGIGFLHRTYTREGKIAAIPRNVEAVEAVLGLSERLDKMGIDSSEMRHAVAKAGAGIARDLNTLLAGEASIEVNGTVHSLAADQQARYIEGARKMLPRGTEHDLGSPDE
jgi:hypothetical protein